MIQESLDRNVQLRTYIPMTTDDMIQQPDLTHSLEDIHDSYATYSVGMTELTYRIQEAQSVAIRMEERKRALQGVRQSINELITITQYIEGL